MVAISNRESFFGSQGMGKGRSSRGGFHSTGGRTSSGRGQSSKLCSHHGKSGHLVKTCYKKHGYRPHLKHKILNNMTTSEDFDDTNSVISQREVSGVSDLSFTLK